MNNICLPVFLVLRARYIKIKIKLSQGQKSDNLYLLLLVTNPAFFLNTERSTIDKESASNNGKIHNDRSFCKILTGGSGARVIQRLAKQWVLTFETEFHQFGVGRHCRGRGSTKFDCIPISLFTRVSPFDPDPVFVKG